MIDLGTGYVVTHGTSADEWIDVIKIFEINAKSTATTTSFVTERIVNYVISHDITNSDYGKNIKYRINHTSDASAVYTSNADTIFDITGFNTLRFTAEGDVTGQRGFVCNAKAFIYVTNTGWVQLESDDRLKHNEININNGLTIIRQLEPQKYQKTNELLDANFNSDLSGYEWTYEAGLIAQDLLQINDLSFVVNGGDYYDGSNNLIESPYYVNYNSIFTYNIAATKELDAIVQNQANEINELKNKNTILENEIHTMKTALNILLTQANLTNI